LLARLKAVETTDFKPAPFDLPALLTTPDKLLGHGYDVTGNARRVQKVSVPEQYRQRLGLDHYYEIDLLIPLDKQAIRLTPAKGKKGMPTYTDGFPATLCVASIPENLDVG
jgi:hypothetical protein